MYACLLELIGDVDMVHAFDDLDVFSRANKLVALSAVQTDFRWRFFHHTLLLFPLRVDPFFYDGLELKFFDLQKNDNLYHNEHMIAFTLLESKISAI